MKQLMLFLLHTGIVYKRFSGARVGTYQFLGLSGWVPFQARHLFEDGWLFE